MFFMLLGQKVPAFTTTVGFSSVPLSYVQAVLDDNHDGDGNKMRNKSKSHTT